MSAPAFTPGPWSVVPYGDERNTNLVIHYSPQNRVCFMATPGQGPDDEQRIEANARLIASAPELYEALEATTEALAGCYIESASVDGDERIINARAALAHARGEQ